MKDRRFFEELEKKAGRDGFLEEAAKLRAFLDWNALIFNDGGRYEVMKDPSILLFISNGYDKLALHFDAKTNTFKSYNASAADLMEWIASEKEAEPADFEDWRMDGFQIASKYMRRFIREFEEDNI